MDDIRELHDSIFYIAEQTKIIQYNLFSKHKQIIHINPKGIFQYYIDDMHQIVISWYPNNIIHWNNKTFRFGGPNGPFIWRYNFIWVGNEIYVHGSSDNMYLMCNKQGTITKINKSSYFNSSYNGKRLIQYCDGDQYVTSPSTIKDIYIINKSNLDYGLCRCDWIDNSDVLVKKNFASGTGIEYLEMPDIYNVDTRQRILAPYGSAIFDANNYIIIQNQQTVLIRDIKTMNILNTIEFPHQIIFYHKQLKIAITKNMNYYKITNQYKLQKVDLGINYHHDMTIYPNQLMDIIIDNNLIDIPNDILYCELYQSLIKYIPSK